MRVASRTETVVAMTGIVSWEHLLFLVSVVSGAVIFAVSILWTSLSFLSKEKAQIEDTIHRIVQERKEDVRRLQDSVEKNDAEVDRRLGALEIFHAGLVSVLKQMDEFRSEVKSDFEQLRNERKDDMRSIHARLDQLMRSRLTKDAPTAP